MYFLILFYPRRESLKKDLTAAQERLIILRGDKPEEGPEEA